MLQLTLGLIAHQSLVTVSFVPRLTEEVMELSVELRYIVG